MIIGDTMESKKILFMILHDEVLYLDENSDMDHKEWYESLGEDMSLFDNVIRGFVIDGKIVFFKAFFNYDEEVIQAAKKYAVEIRNKVNNFELGVYCGILHGGGYGKNWETIVEIKEEELKNNKDKNEKKEKIVKKVETTSDKQVPIINNDYNSDSYTKIGFAISMITLGLSMIIIGMAVNSHTLQFKGMGDAILVLFQFVLLIVVIVGYRFKASYTKYLSFGVSLLMILTFNIFEIILAVLYALFSIDMGYFTKSFSFIKSKLSKN